MMYQAIDLLWLIPSAIGAGWLWMWVTVLMAHIAARNGIYFSVPLR